MLKQFRNVFLKNLAFSIKARRGLQRKHLKRQNSAQCQSVRSLTPHSVSLCRVTYFVNISAKTKLPAKPFWHVYQGPRWVSFIEKNAKNLVTIFKVCRYTVLYRLGSGQKESDPAGFEKLVPVCKKFFQNIIFHGQ